MGSANIIGIKIAAYQDRLKSRDQLMWLEYLNTKCDKRAKKLICNERREVVPFLFSLQSSYATSSIRNLTLNTKDNILISILLTVVKPYLQKKL